MSTLKTKSETIAKEFSLEGLREHFITQIDVESYSDTALSETYEEFLFQLSLQVRKTADSLAGCGVNFFWAVYLEDAILDPQDVRSDYIYSDESERSYEGINAIIASLVYGFDIDALVCNYWRVKDLHLV